MTPLSEAQIESFKTHGFVVLPGLIDTAVRREWKRQIEADLGAPPDAEAAAAALKDRWPASKDTSVLQDYRFSDGFDFHRLDGVRAVLEQMGAGCFRPREGDGNPHILWPVPGADWAVAADGHVDGYAGGRWFSFMCGATTYLYDVGPRQGGTFLWPGSHLRIWRYYRAHPQAVSAGECPERDAAFGAIAAEQPPVEATMAAGDVLLWHHNLYHSPSKNAGQRPRWAFFVRCHHEREVQMRHEAPRDPWTHWGI